MEETKTEKITAGTWAVMLVTGLVGQLCWNIENQWFNTFVYAKIAPDPDIIAWMVALTAITQVITTVFFGTWSDRIGSRKPNIIIGYFVWGITIIIFGTTQFLSGNVAIGAAAVIAADCLMTTFGCMGYDAGFNPWTTDLSAHSKRGSIGAMCALLPVIATILGSLIFGNIIEKTDYFLFFVIIGVAVTALSFLMQIFVKDSPYTVKTVDEKGFMHQFASFFQFRMLKENEQLKWVLFVFATYFIGFQMYFPHLTNYLIYSLGYPTGRAGIIFGVSLLLATPATILGARMINAKKHYSMMYVSVASTIAGLISLGLFKGLPATVIGLFLIGVGYMTIFQTLMVLLKNLYPEGQKGQSEGLRCVFYVCIPMCIGTPIGSMIINNTGIRMVNEYGIEGYSAAGNIYLWAAAWIVLTVIPIYFAGKASLKEN
ncbi:MAG: MFS transporter [Eubacteriales bacterium]|nr:MFS transporter [Eubacteriales bacterium]